ncbi:DUF1348 family protein [Paraburkholderia sp. LEh10]|uniref:DUF1348 family protein n=1 Tax=Paraburkholderia sp. LEh10 TaxID=2821353 RepID=UPI0039182176
MTRPSHSSPAARHHSYLKSRALRDRDCDPRTELVHNRDEARAFLERKWRKVLDYRLVKELWTYGDNRIAVRYACQWRDDAGNGFRSYGNENWKFGLHGLMHHRHASINDMPIKENERKFHCPLGRRPDDHTGLSELGL